MYSEHFICDIFVTLPRILFINFNFALSFNFIIINVTIFFKDFGIYDCAVSSSLFYTFNVQLNRCTPSKLKINEDNRIKVKIVERLTKIDARVLSL